MGGSDRLHRRYENSAGSVASEQNWGFDAEDVRIIGQAFNTYVIAQSGDTMIIADQHAAHERLKYEELKSGKASHAETLKLTYDDSLISLEKILEHFLRFVDPYSIDKQAHDIGHQYRSGVYYINKDESLLYRQR